MIFTEQSMNPPRIIPLDGRPHISDNIRQFPGDSRGRLEGETLVVETKNFTDRLGRGAARHTGEPRAAMEQTLTVVAAWSPISPRLGSRS